MNQSPNHGGCAEGLDGICYYSRNAIEEILTKLMAIIQKLSEDKKALDEQATQNAATIQALEKQASYHYLLLSSRPRLKYIALSLVLTVRRRSKISKSNKQSKG